MFQGRHPQSARIRLFIITLLATQLILQGCQASSPPKPATNERTGNRLIIPQILEDLNAIPTSLTLRCMFSRERWNSFLV